VGVFLVHIYMVALYFIFPAVLQLALAMGGSPNARRISMANFSIAALIALAHSSGYVISGFEFLSWTVITSPGEYYVLAMLYILLNSLAAVGYLTVKTVLSKDFEVRERTRVNLIAMAPLFMVAFGVILLRLQGFNSSSAISLPIATTLFLFVLLLQTNGNLFWLSLRLKSIIEILKIKDLSSIDQIIDRLDEVRIRQALRATNGSQRNTAQLIKLSEPTLSRRISRYGIDVSRYQTRPVRSS
ncbi:MAG: helix-turn-helix domain-containing protein, partial [Gimesia chilikensis]